MSTLSQQLLLYARDWLQLQLQEIYSIGLYVIKHDMLYESTLFDEDSSHTKTRIMLYFGTPPVAVVDCRRLILHGGLHTQRHDGVDYVRLVFLQRVDGLFP